MQSKSQESLKGEIFILLGAVAGSMLPILSNPKSISVSPFWMVAIGSFISFFVFLSIFLAKNLVLELKRTKAVQLSALAGLIIGFFYTGLVYVGTYYTSPQNASIIVSFDVFVAMLLFRNHEAEKLRIREICGGVLLVLAGAILFLPATVSPNVGDLILFCACFLSPIGNLIMKRARKEISTETILLVRTFVSSILLLVLAFAVSGVPDISDLRSSAFALILNGILVLGISKMLWIEGINLIPIAKASSIMSTGPVLTYLFAWLLLDDLPSWNQVLAIPVCMSGLFLVLSSKGVR